MCGYEIKFCNIVEAHAILLNVSELIVNNAYQYQLTTDCRTFRPCTLYAAVEGLRGRNVPQSVVN